MRVIGSFRIRRERYDRGLTHGSIEHVISASRPNKWTGYFMVLTHMCSSAVSSVPFFFVPPPFSDFCTRRRSRTCAVCLRPYERSGTLVCDVPDVPRLSGWILVHWGGLQPPPY